MSLMTHYKQIGLIDGCRASKFSAD